MKRNNSQYKKGIAIFIAVITVSALMLIAMAISDIAYKEQIISASGRDSRIAFYAADTGIECALFHDLKGGGTTLFTYARPGVDQAGDIICNEATVVADVSNSSSPAITTFYFNISDTPESCTIVRVLKTDEGDGNFSTAIESRGYNNHCEDDGPVPNPRIVSGSRNLERSLRVTY